MNLVIESDDITDYLKNTMIIDFQNENIIELAKYLKIGVKSEIDLIRKTYEYVRDNINHSADVEGKVVTCKASDVLREKEGICYAKSHLLAALLRGMGIPTGFCYQRLILDDDQKNYLILHGLNAIYIKKIKKWIRVDARGNKKGVDAQFSLEEEKLAFPIRKEFKEEDIPLVFVEPDANIIKALNTYETVAELFDNLPQKLEKEFIKAYSYK
ncbi:transglutaminase-like protein [Gottschalkia purinilytica]|uniref:Transglutaminase-like protein n=1 Tax=Gottschalkia purinilytica TaxID=1503 RepID=A0A0L0WCS1_GOTPU|nr:transglutaminase-like domain-containing protein [Gottschalkia purinilytica]KNF09256.1 transglutaminase-like protein [Gottschalkia purinilytica]